MMAKKMRYVLHAVIVYVSFEAITAAAQTNWAAIRLLVWIEKLCVRLTCEKRLDRDHNQPAGDVSPADPEALRRDVSQPLAICRRSPYHQSIPLISAQSIDEVVLATRGWPDGGHLAQAGGECKVAQHAEEEPVQQRDGASRRQDKPD